MSAGWSLVVPVKVLGQAKSRLAAVAGPYRERLALAVAADTVAAALRCPRIRQVIVVTDDSLAARELTDLGAQVVADEPNAGLNPALRHGAGLATAPGGIGAMSADLPALRPEELARVLDAATTTQQAFVTDAAQTGSTLYTAGPNADFSPSFGDHSRDRHLTVGARELLLDGIDSVRRDVDTAEDLLDALRLKAGPRTTDVAQHLDLPQPRR